MGKPLIVDECIAADHPVTYYTVFGGIAQRNIEGFCGDKCVDVKKAVHIFGGMDGISGKHKNLCGNLTGKDAKNVEKPTPDRPKCDE